MTRNRNVDKTVSTTRIEKMTLLEVDIVAPPAELTAMRGNTHAAHTI